MKTQHQDSEFYLFIYCTGDTKHNSTNNQTAKGTVCTLRQQFGKLTLGVSKVKQLSTQETDAGLFHSGEGERPTTSSLVYLQDNCSFLK